MLKVLLVDDELIVRKGIESTINFTKYGFSQVLEAGNGLDAIKMYKRYKPDLIITDIKMPGLSGIDLIEQICAINDNDCQFIILSGYNDFEYVKSALALGVIDYVLKPIANDDFIKVLKKAYDKILSIRASRKSVRELNQKLAFLHTNFISQILSGAVDKSKIKSKIDSYLNDFTYKEFYVAYVSGVSSEKPPLHSSDIFAIHCEIDKNSYAFIIFDDEEFAFVKNLMNTYSKAKIGISESFDNVENIPLAFSHAREALLGCNNQEISFYLGDKSENMDFLIEQAKEYVRKNYSQQIYSSQVAKSLHLSESYFCFLFKKNTGVSCHDYVTKYRVEMALRLINLRKYKIYEICNMVGYKDLKHFREVFKRHTGKTPIDVIRSIADEDEK